MKKSPPSGVVISLPLDADLYTWEAIMDGPKDSLYQGKLLYVIIMYVKNYMAHAYLRM